ncbi:PadR family transcriptional regulator [bacterium]|nr:PadR family transcriptional regulator [bacterium]
MQDKILLGFLQDGEKTGYQIKKLMESSTGYFFNTSLGSIYPAFRKLEKDGMVKMKQKVTEGRVKKLYSVTEKGMECFQTWLNEEITIPKARDEVLLKIFFFSNLEPEKRREKIIFYVKQLQGMIDHLSTLKNLVEVNTSNRDEKKVNDYLNKYKIDAFRIEMLDYGVEYYIFMKKWYEDFLNRIDDVDKH